MAQPDGQSSTLMVADINGGALKLFRDAEKGQFWLARGDGIHFGPLSAENMLDLADAFVSIIEFEAGVANRSH